MQRYKIVYSGTLKAEADPERFVQGFVQVFKAPEAKARKLATLGRALTLKDNLDRARADQYRQVMEKLGMQVQVEPMAAEPSQVRPEPENAPEPSPQPAPSEGRRCPKCGSDRVRGDDCHACGIIIPRYLERQAREVADAASQVVESEPASSDETVELEPAEPSGDTTFSAAHGVSIGNGFGWITQGWHYFRRNPLSWIGAILIWVAIMFLGGLIPFVGPVATVLLGPVLVAGFFIGADVQHEGGDFEVGHLFEGFSNNQAGLLIIGFVNILASAVIGGLAFFMVMATLGGDRAAPAGLGDAVGLAAALALPLVVTMVLSILLGLANVLAPALVALEGVAPLTAMMMSLKGCLKNIIPIIIFVLAALVIILIASIPVGLGLLVAVPVLTAATYASFRDIFYQ